MAVTADTDRILDILRNAAQSREIKNLSKDTLAAVITYVAPRIVDPSLHSDLIKDLSAHLVPASNPNTEVDDSVGTQTSSPLAMRPLSQTPINGDSEGFRRREEISNRVLTYARSHFLAVNSDKTQIMWLGTKEAPPVVVGSHCVTPSKSVEVLGV